MSADNDNLIEAEEMLREIGADAVWTIHAATHTSISFVLEGHQMMLPIRDGGTLLVAYFPPQLDTNPA